MPKIEILKEDKPTVSEVLKKIILETSSFEESRTSGYIQGFLEAWDIWIKWKDAYDKGKVTLGSQRALPADQTRHEALKRLIGDRLTGPWFS